jgi:hypothetical protein
VIPYHYSIECDAQEPTEPTSSIEGFDISGLDAPWDDDEDCTDAGKADNVAAEDATNASPIKRRVGVCPGHERGLPVNELVHLLDMKEEGMKTRNIHPGQLTWSV